MRRVVEGTWWPRSTFSRARANWVARRSKCTYVIALVDAGSTESMYVLCTVSSMQKYASAKSTELMLRSRAGPGLLRGSTASGLVDVAGSR